MQVRREERKGGARERRDRRERGSETERRNREGKREIKTEVDMRRGKGRDIGRGEGGREKER